jgi:hypothetical protein
MGLFSKNYGAIQVDKTLKERILNKKPTGSVISVRPSPDSNSMKNSQEVLKTLHKTFDTSFFELMNTSQVSTFEIWYTDGKVQFLYYIEDTDTRERFLKQLGAFFEDAQIKVLRDSHFPSVNEGEWVAGGRFNLRKHYFEPIRYPGGTKSMEFDPYRSITQDITAKADTRMVIQVALKPVVKNWDSTFTKDVSEHGDKMKRDETVKVLKGLTFQEYEVSKSSDIRKASKDIQEQKGKPAFHVNLRMMAFGPTRAQAISQCESVGRIYEQTHEEVTKQTLVPVPQDNGELPRFIDDMVLRRGRNMSLPKNPISVAARKLSTYARGSYDTMVMTLPEVTGLAHLPDESIRNNKVNWNRLNIEGTLPPDAPKFEDFHNDDDEDDQESQDTTEEPATETTESVENDEDMDSLIDDSMDGPMEEFIE